MGRTCVIVVTIFPNVIIWFMIGWSDPWVFLTGRSSSTLSKCYRIGDQHSRWFVVFSCQVPREVEKNCNPKITRIVRVLVQHDGTTYNKQWLCSRKWKHYAQAYIVLWEYTSDNVRPFMKKYTSLTKAKIILL